MAAAFNVGDKVLAYHGPLMYAAKIIEVDVQGSEPRYFIHYDGWKRKWDEWVAGDRLQEDSPENQERLKQLSNEARQAKKTAAAAPAKRAKTEAVAKPDAEADDDAESAEDDNPFEDSAVKLNLPQELKALVVKDWENITQKGLLVQLPRSPSIRDVFARFMSERQRKNAHPFAQVTEGLSVYFDRALPTILLYRAEREQFEHVKTRLAGKRFCEVYGVEHLLRLFVRLPQLLAHADIGEADLALLLQRMQDVFKFIIDKPECVGSDPYVAAALATVPASAASAADDDDAVDAVIVEATEAGGASDAGAAAAE